MREIIFLFNLVGMKIKRIHSVAFNIRSGFGDEIAQMMLRNNVKHKTMLDDLNIFLLGYRFQQCSFRFLFL